MISNWNYCGNCFDDLFVQCLKFYSSIYYVLNIAYKYIYLFGDFFFIFFISCFSVFYNNLFMTV